MKNRGVLASQVTAVKYALIGAIAVLGLVCLYYGSAFAPGLPRSDYDGAGPDPFTGGLVTHRDLEDVSEDQAHNPHVPKTIPVSSAIYDSAAT